MSTLGYADKSKAKASFIYISVTYSYMYIVQWFLLQMYIHHKILYLLEEILKLGFCIHFHKI